MAPVHNGRRNALIEDAPDFSQNDPLTSQSDASIIKLMRTTLTLDKDVAKALERESKTRRISFKEVVNHTLRRGLVLGRLSDAPLRKVTAKSFGGGLLPGFDPDRMNQLYDELEAEAFRSKAKVQGI